MTCSEIYPGGSIEAYGKEFLITGVDQFTKDYYQQTFGRSFYLGQIDYPHSKEQTPI